MASPLVPRPTSVLGIQVGGTRASRWCGQEAACYDVERTLLQYNNACDCNEAPIVTFVNAVNNH